MILAADPWPTVISALGVALITTSGVVIVAMLRRSETRARETHETVRATYDQMNRVDEVIEPGSGADRPPNLRQIVERGFAENDAAHERIGRVLDDHGTRLDRLDKRSRDSTSGR